MTSSSLGDKDQGLLELEQQMTLAKEIEARIQDLRSQLNKARKEYREVQHRISSLRASSAPVRRLPRDILVTVFEYHPEDQKCRNSTLLRVCKMWHEIAMNTSSLWNYITLKLDRVETISLVWKYANACLERSRARPLHIWIDGRTFGPPIYGVSDFGEDLVQKLFSKIPISRYVTDPDARGIWSDDSPSYDARIYEYGLLLALGVLRGDENQFVERWKSLRLDTNPALDHQAAFRLLDSLSNYACNLDTLDCRSENKDYWVYIKLWDILAIDTVRNLTFDFMVEGHQDSYGYMNHVENLVILGRGSPLSVMVNAGFESLQSLELAEDLRSGTESINMPNLKFLSIQTGVTLKGLILPRLTHLYIRTPSAFPACTLTSVTDFRYVWGKISLLTELKEACKMMPSLERFHVLRALRYPYVDVAAALEENRGELGTLAVCLEDPTRSQWPVALEFNWQ